MSLLGTVAGKATTAAAPWLELIKPFWPLIWRALLAAAIFWAGWHYGGKSAERQLEEFKTAQANATAASVLQLSQELADRTKEMTKQEVENIHEINSLKAQQAARPDPVVRVCVPARPRPVSSVPGAAAGNAPDAGGAGELPAGVGIDIGGRVQKLVNRADVVRTKCINGEDRSDFLSSQEPMTIPVK